MFLSFWWLYVYLSIVFFSSFFHWKILKELTPESRLSVSKITIPREQPKECRLELWFSKLYAVVTWSFSDSTIKPSYVYLLKKIKVLWSFLYRRIFRIMLWLPSQRFAINQQKPVVADKLIHSKARLITYPHTAVRRLLPISSWMEGFAIPLFMTLSSSYEYLLFSRIVVVQKGSKRFSSTYWNKKRCIWNITWGLSGMYKGCSLKDQTNDLGSDTAGWRK